MGRAPRRGVRLGKLHGSQTAHIPDSSALSGQVEAPRDTLAEVRLVTLNTTARIENGRSNYESENVRRATGVRVAEADCAAAEPFRSRDPLLANSPEEPRCPLAK